MKDEIRTIAQKYFSGEKNTVHYYGDAQNLLRIGQMLPFMVQSDYPDGYAICDNDVLMLEHFEFDSSDCNKNGSQLRRAEAADDRAFEKLEVINGEAKYVGSIEANLSTDNYRDNLIRAFAAHYNKIDSYKQSLVEKGVDLSGKKVTTCFFIEDTTLLGSIFESKSKDYSWEPLILPRCDFFLDLFEKSPKLDCAFCGSWYPSESCLWFIDRSMIDDYREHQLITSEIHLIRMNPWSVGYKAIVPTESIPECWKHE